MECRAAQLEHQRFWLVNLRIDAAAGCVDPAAGLRSMLRVHSEQSGDYARNWRFREPMTKLGNRLSD
jgi:hypothetical protein